MVPMLAWRTPRFSRRDLLKSSAALGGALVIATYLPPFAQAAERRLGVAPRRPQDRIGFVDDVARALVELHGGRVEARSEGFNKGSEFVVTLPLFLPLAVSVVSG